MKRIIVFKASRDTLALLACTVAATLALAYGVHRRDATATAPSSSNAQQDWAGRLANQPVAPAASPEPVTSESLVVPRSALTLPAVQPAVAARSKPQGCDTPPCPAKYVAARPIRQRAADLAAGPIVLDAPNPAASSPTAPNPAAPNLAAPKPTVVEVAAPASKNRSFAFSDLNPLPHLPDAVRRPFSYAGTKIGGWFDRL